MLTNKKDQHRRSVETLGLSGHGDERIIAEIAKLVQSHTPWQPYSRNTLLRVQDLIERHLASSPPQTLNR